jgi:putative salt-induced outer membrane protein
MSRSRRLLTAVASLLVMGAAAAPGQDVPARSVSFAADLGFVKTGGNTNLTTVSVGEKVEFRTGSSLVFQQSFGWVFGKTDGVESANQMQAGLRGIYDIREHLTAYAGTNYYRDRFAGIAKRFDESVGFGYQLAKTERHEVSVESGISFFQETLTAGSSNRFTAGRAAGRYKFHFAEKAHFEQYLEYLSNFDHGDDYRMISESLLVAPINSLLALKAGYLVRYRGEPPSGFDKTDTTFRTSIQLTL